MEMTGLNEASDCIMEIATVITDYALQPLDEGLEFVIKQPRQVLEAMKEPVLSMHANSGLTNACLTSSTTLAEAEGKTLSYIAKHISQAKTAPLCGNSVHTDRRFLRKFMPSIDEHLHYRIVDVSSVRLLADIWFPEAVQKRPPKSENHRALGDILESIQELKFYRDHVFAGEKSATAVQL